MNTISRFYFIHNRLLPNRSNYKYKIIQFAGAKCQLPLQLVLSAAMPLSEAENIDKVIIQTTRGKYFSPMLNFQSSAYLADRFFSLYLMNQHWLNGPQKGIYKHKM